jgi:hypothetical protein
VQTFITLMSRSRAPYQYIYIYIYISDNIYLMMNKSQWEAGVPSSWKSVLCGRLERRCTMIVLLNRCDPVLGGSVFPR